MKFLFTRLEEPQYPIWNSAKTEWQPTDNGGDAMWRHLWKWHAGERNGGHSVHKGSVADHIEALRGESELACLNAAYTLEEISESAVPALIETLHDESEAA